MHLSRLGVHESVRTVFPPARLVDALSDRSGVDVTAVEDDGIPDCDAVVTLEHRDTFVDLEWVHSIQAGIDRFPLETFEERGVVLTNSTGIHGRSVGETVAGYLHRIKEKAHDFSRGMNPTTHVTNHER
ncbi:hypothetical protein [Natronoglomus mannanivorans]|uniref:hypothetical protein n=1 Tax=Natronoglomus mannanivorans TaxID=2979990 RepID=UPI003CCD7AE2